jgi:hypothetical protein
LIRTPIRQVLSTIRGHQVLALLMGGQACVFYGAAQFSKNIDFLILAGETNFAGLRGALAELDAVRIAVPPFDPEHLARGHAVHYRCRADGVEGLRIDLMTRPRDLPAFETLWPRRTTIRDEEGETFDLLSVPDLVQAKKTQREKDWIAIGALVEGHYHAMHAEPTPERIVFWLTESRTPERLVALASDFSKEAGSLQGARPLLAHAVAGNLPALRAALDAEARAEQDKDRAYWAPLRRELEAFRPADRRSSEASPRLKRC